MKLRTYVWYAFSGAAIGTAMLHLVLVPAGGGHGTMIPVWLFFAPVLFFVYCFPHSQDLIIQTCVVLYSGYALLIRWGNRRNRGGVALLAVLIFHSVAAGLCLFHEPEILDLADLQKSFQAVPIWTVAAFAMFPLVLLLGTYVALKAPVVRGDAPRCHRCDYNLTGNESGVCPECGCPTKSSSAVDGDRGP